MSILSNFPSNNQDNDVFIATYGTTTSAEIEAAYLAGKIVLCKDNIRCYFFCGNLNTMLFTTAMPDTAGKGVEGALYWVSPKASATGGWAKGWFKADPNTHASTHATDGSDPITPAMVGLDKSALLKSVEVYLPASASWQSVTFGNKRFVAVAGSSNIAAYSDDGITWNQTTLPSSGYWQSVTYGNGKFVAVAQDSSIAAYSLDGIIWNAINLPTLAYTEHNSKWCSVTYGNGKFVVVSAYGSDAVAYSTDGITWNQTTLPSSGDWQSVTYGNGKFVAVGRNSNIAAYSVDGITWTQTTIPSSTNWTSVTFGNNRFVVVYFGSSTASYSDDGITWTEITLPANAKWKSVTFGNNRFVAVVQDDNIAAYSDDGITWTQTNLPASVSWSSVTFGNNRFVAVAYDSNIAACSDDGITWYNSIDVLTYPDNTDIKDRMKSILDIDQSVSAEEKAKWNAKADAPFKPKGKSYLTFSSPNSFTLKVNDTTKHWNGTLEYFAEDKIWTVWDGTTTLSSVDNDGEYVLYLRGAGNVRITGDNSNYRWVLTGSNILCIGNIENLLDYATVESGNHPRMIEYCYNHMFNSCDAIIQAPELPATTLANYCYAGMFYDCTNLTHAPDLPATTLAAYCYNDMFSGCTALTQAPVLPANTLEISCYSSMFYGCTNLTNVPNLPATELKHSCYHWMFRKCTSLKVSSTLIGEYTQEYRIPMSGTGTTADVALDDMFSETGGTFTGTPEINTTYYLSSDNMVVRETEIATLNGYVASMIDAAIGNAIGGSY